MAGLESIALAVAHLERIEKASDDDDTTGSADGKNTQLQPPTSIPFQRTPRLVSTDINRFIKEENHGNKEEAYHLNPFGGQQGKVISHTIQLAPGTNPIERTTQSAAALPNTTNPSQLPSMNHYYGRAMVMNEISDRMWEQGRPTDFAQPKSTEMQGSSEMSSEQPRFRNQISQKILLKCKKEDGASDDPVARLLAQIASVTDDLPLLFELMEHLCEHGRQAGGAPAEILGPEEEITDVRRHDVLSGRGGETNHHYGNVQYRRIVKACQPAYLVAKRRDKPNVAAAIVRVVRARSGRFLKKKSGKTTWHDVGNTKAREKSSQALREGAPELRGFVQMEGMPAAVASGAVRVVPSLGRQMASGTAFSHSSPAPPRQSSVPVRSPLVVASKPNQVRRPEPTPVTKTPAVGDNDGEIKQSAFLQAMEHYKNLYGKPKDPPVEASSGEKRKTVTPNVTNDKDNAIAGPKETVCAPKETVCAPSPSLPITRSPSLPIAPEALNGGSDPPGKRQKIKEETA